MRRPAAYRSALFPGPWLGLWLSVVSCAGDSTGRATVEIVEPADGAAAQARDVRVVLRATAVEIAPATDEREGTAHHHLFVDRGLTPVGDTIPAGVTGIIHLGRGQAEFLLRGLAPGEHTVIAMLGDRGHVPLEPLKVDTVRFTVAP